MEVHFTLEQEAKLTQLANDAGTDAAGLVKDMVLRLLIGDGEGSERPRIVGGMI